MRILLIGYGKMGQSIHNIALDRKHEIIDIIDIKNQEIFKNYSHNEVDVAIEFSTPQTAVDNYKQCFENGISVVSGTTGWLTKFKEVENYSLKNSASFFYASNFSIGVNIFFQINKKLAKLMKSYSEYELNMEEIHHLQKLDAPSGTAITLAEDIMEENNYYKGWFELKNEISKNKIPILCKRKKDVFGIHSVTYNSPVDTITINHTAHSREGFALGAVLAAEWLIKQENKKCYFMKDMLGFS